MRCQKQVGFKASVRAESEAGLQASLFRTICCVNELCPEKNSLKKDDRDDNRPCIRLPAFKTPK
jgi:hypothetical protein